MYLLSGGPDKPEKRVCVGGVAPYAHPFLGRLSNVPNNIKVDAKVIVYQAIASPCYRFPGNM